MRLRALVLPLAFAVAGSIACSDSPTSPTETTASEPPYTITFESAVAPTGASSRTFVAVGPGTVSVTLTSTTPAGLPLGIGVGIPSPSPAGCSLTRTATTTAGSSPQLWLTVDAGTYCVQVYDPGVVVQPAWFSVTLVHP